MKTLKGKNISARINALQEVFGVNEKILAQMLRVSKSSVRRWQKNIGVSRADRLPTLHKLEELMKLSETTFAKGKAKEWYHGKAISLGGETPIDFMLKNADGVEKVTNLVGCIEWGIYT